jgi:transglutaminase-like putative cysteine protease
MLGIVLSQRPPGTSAVSIHSLRAALSIHWTLALFFCAQAPLLAADETEPAAAAAGDVIKGDAADVEIIQETVSPAVEPSYGNPIATRMRVGARVEAKGGEVREIFIMVAVPLECPEQEVHVVEEDFSSNIGNVEFRNLPDQKLAEPGARQMLITIPLLGARQTANAVVTYEILTKHVYAPEQTAGLVIPAKPPKQLKTFLSGSPYINVNDRKIRDAIKQALEQRVTKETDAGEGRSESDESASPGDSSPPEGEDAYETVDATANASADSTTTEPKAAGGGAAVGKSESDSSEASESTSDQAEKKDPAAIAAAIEELTAWQRVEALYDFVRTKVKYLDGAEDMSSVQALKAEQADCHGLSALFVAMCRTMKVPARMVWVDGHQYAEFYLEDEAGKGYWYPAQLAGTRAFGEMPTPMVIFQKGDNFRVPERRRERLRYATDHTTLSSSPKHKPRVVYIREQL